MISSDDSHFHAPIITGDSHRKTVSALLVEHPSKLLPEDKMIYDLITTFDGEVIWNTHGNTTQEGA